MSADPPAPPAPDAALVAPPRGRRGATARTAVGAATATTAAGADGRLPLGAVALFVGGALSLHLGSAFAVLLFDEVAAGSVAWLRVLVAAVVLLAWRRPWRASRRARGRWDGRRLGLVVAFGTVLALMNTFFYLAIDRLPVGTVVAVEFLGPLTVAALGSRGVREVASLLLALVGVLLLADVRLVAEPAGTALALAAAACWGTYVVLGSRVARGGDGVDALAVGTAAGAVVLAPVLLPGAVVAATDLRLALACLAVGVASSAVPYAVDQVVLRRVAAPTFAVLQALLPVTATVAALVVLVQVPAALEAVGIAVVVVAVALRR